MKVRVIKTPAGYCIEKLGMRGWEPCSFPYTSQDDAVNVAKVLAEPEETKVVFEGGEA